MKNNQKTFFKRFLIGLKLGWNTPLLPPKIIYFHNYPLVRIFRVVGGLSVLTVLLKKHLLLFLPLQYLILFLAFLHISYIVVISLVKIFYGISRFWTDELNVRSSPLDHFASLTTKLLVCWKIGCQVGASGIGLAGSSVITDSILEARGQEKVFTPLIARGVKFMIGGVAADNLYTDINKNLINLKASQDRLCDIKKLADECDSVLSPKDFSIDNLKSIKSAFEEVKKMEKFKLESYAKDLSEKIREYSDNNK